MSENAHPTIKTFVGVWIALLILTVVTVTVATFNLGVFSAVVALTIATIKALLVMLFFMEIKYASKMTMTVVISAIFFLFLLLGLTIMDYTSRPWGVFFFKQ